MTLLHDLFWGWGERLPAGGKSVWKALSLGEKKSLMCSREWKEPGLVMASAVNGPFRSPFYASSHFKHHNDSQGEPHSWVGWDPEKNEVTQLPSKRVVQLGFQPGQWILEPGLVSRLHYYAVCRDSLDHILKAKETWPAGLDILLSAIENHRDILSRGVHDNFMQKVAVSQQISSDYNIHTKQGTEPAPRLSSK